MDNCNYLNVIRNLRANQEFNMKIRIQDIIFWILILLIISVALWKLVGSPTDTEALIAISLFVAGSEILIWKAIFAADKKTSISFVKIKNDIDIVKNHMDNKFNQVNSRLDNIENLIRKKK